MWRSSIQGLVIPSLALKESLYSQQKAKLRAGLSVEVLG